MIQTFEEMIERVGVANHIDAPVIIVGVASVGTYRLAVEQDVQAMHFV